MRPFSGAGLRAEKSRSWWLDRRRNEGREKVFLSGSNARRLLERNGVRRFALDLFIGISFGSAASHHRSPTSAFEPAGQDPGMCQSTGTGHTSALFARKSQSFLDNVIVGFRP